MSIFATHQKCDEVWWSILTGTAFFNVEIRYFLNLGFFWEVYPQMFTKIIFRVLNKSRAGLKPAYELEIGRSQWGKGIF